MGDIYQASVSFDNVTVTPALSASPVTGSNIVDGGFAFVAGDTVGVRYAITIRVNRVQDISGIHWAATATFMRRQRYGITGAPPDSFNVFQNYPGIWGGLSASPISGAQQYTDSTGAGYFGGGTLSITKDYNAGTVTWSSPMGGGVFPLLQPFGFVPDPTEGVNPSPLYPQGLGAFADFPTDPAVTPLNAEATAQAFNFYMKKNGRLAYGHALSATDTTAFPGTFEVYPGLDASVEHHEAQLPTRYRIGYSVTSFDYTLPFFNVNGQFSETRYSGQLPSYDGSVDMEKAPEHGILFRAWPGSFQGDQMWFTRSFNNGGHWETTVVAADATIIGGSNQYQSPSLNYVNSGLYLCWHDGTNIVEAKSNDGGATWDMPVTIPFTGTNPRKISDKTGGPQYLFFVTPGGDINVVVTYDGGLHYLGPYTVDTNVGAQQLDGEFAPDSSVVVTYTSAGILTQKRSRDLGRTWT